MNIRHMVLEKDWGWFTHHLPIFYVEDTCGIVMEDAGGERVAAAIFDNYTGKGGSLQAHLLVLNKKAFRYGFLDAICDWAFDGCGVCAVYALVPSNKPNAVTVNKKIGFKELVRMKNAVSPGVDSILMELKREDCNYGNV